MADGTMGLFVNAVMLFSLLGQGQASAPLKLKPGDVLSISAPETYGGEYTIMSDGAIYGKGFGRVTVAGLSVQDSEKAVRFALRRFVREQLVFATLAKQRPEFVFLIGGTSTMAPTQGAIPWMPDLTLRQLLAAANIKSDLDLMEVAVIRNGNTHFSSRLNVALAGPDLILAPSDVVSLLPVSQVRVWISGSVRTPGSILVEQNADLSRVLAAAGGMAFGTGDSQDESVVLIRRGPKTLEFPARDVATLKSIPVEPGDDISVVLPAATRITVAGEVTKPGEYLLKGDSSIQKALAMSGGPNAQGSISSVRVIRGPEMFVIDASKPETRFSLQPYDMLIVERNKANIYVLGEVTRPGRLLMQDNRKYRVTDALAEVGGLSTKGTLRRVYLARPDAYGKTVIRQFNLDEYLKDGRLESNPELQSGDCLLFGQPNGLSFNALQQFLTSTVLIHNLSRN